MKSTINNFMALLWEQRPRPNHLYIYRLHLHQVAPFSSLTVSYAVRRRCIYVTRFAIRSLPHY